MSTFYEHRTEKLFIGGMTQHPFPVHVHEVAELVVLTAGSVRVTIDGIPYALSPGDAAIIFPLTPHSFEEIGDGAEGLAAIFPTDLIPEYSGTFHGLVPECPLLPAAQTGPDLQSAVSRLCELEMEKDLPFCIAYLHVVLAGLLHSLTYRPVYNYAEQNLGYQIMRYVSDHCCEALSLESVSRALGISASHLSHFFSEKLNVSFRGFINANRIAKARMMLRDPNLTLTQICGECGYESMRTFRRAFVKEVGCLPSEHLVALRKRVAALPEISEKQ